MAVGAVVEAAVTILKLALKRVGEPILGARDLVGLAMAETAIAPGPAFDDVDVAGLGTQHVCLATRQAPRLEPVANGGFDVDDGARAAGATTIGHVPGKADVGVGVLAGGSDPSVVAARGAVAPVGSGRQGKRHSSEGEGEGLVHGVSGLLMERPVALDAVNGFCRRELCPVARRPDE
jgi:hypothetical protein